MQEHNAERMLVWKSSKRENCTRGERAQVSCLLVTPLHATVAVDVLILVLMLVLAEKSERKGFCGEHWHCVEC